MLTNGSVILRARQPAAHPEGPARAARAVGRPADQPVGFQRGFAELFGDTHPLSKDEARAQWALLARDDGHRILHLLCYYLTERVDFASRWHGAVRDWPKPLAFLWAIDDPVATPAVLAGLRQLRPGAETVELRYRALSADRDTHGVHRGGRSAVAAGA